MEIKTIKDLKNINIKHDWTKSLFIASKWILKYLNQYFKNEIEIEKILLIDFNKNSKNKSKYFDFYLINENNEELIENFSLSDHNYSIPAQEKYGERIILEGKYEYFDFLKYEIDNYIENIESEIQYFKNNK